MRIGAFEVAEPLPELKDPHAFAILKPWVDVGSVGTLTALRFEERFTGREVARVARPGTFFDFTRYRPSLVMNGDKRELEVPTATVSAVHSAGGQDFLFLKLLEPNMYGEDFVDSIVALLDQFRVKRYALIGAMYDTVPHTRPFAVSGSGSNLKLNNELEPAGVAPSQYLGPTSIVTMVGQLAAGKGIETLSLIVHLPNYLTLENDFRGVVRILEVLHSLYGIAVSEEDQGKAREQAEQVKQIADQILEKEPQYKMLLRQLELNYDARHGTAEQRKTPLSPELEKLLQDLGSRFGDS